MPRILASSRASGLYPPLTLIYCRPKDGWPWYRATEGRTTRKRGEGGLRSRYRENEKNASRTNKKKGGSTKKKHVLVCHRRVTHTHQRRVHHAHQYTPHQQHPKEAYTPGDWRDGGNEVGLILGVHGPRAAAQLHRFRFASSKSW